jgi:hypothetical protein
MSGSSGGGGGGGSSSGGSSAGDCSIVERVPLNSPQAAVVATLIQGQKLNVELRGGSVVAVVAASNSIAGSLTPRRLVELIDCMDQGRQYHAVIITVRGALCEVEIRPRV